MKTFTQWAEEHKIELPPISEQGLRTGYSANYPPQYASGQYPHHYFNPIKATADLEKQWMDKKEIVTPPPKK
jgi:hypothetical protein